MVIKTAALHRPGAAWWLIARKGPCGRLEALDVGVGGWRALPVFSFREGAEMFLHLAKPGDGWRVRESRPGEVASVLCGVCRGVQSVALDPLPGMFAEGTAAQMDRERFLGRLLAPPGAGTRGTWRKAKRGDAA